MRPLRLRLQRGRSLFHALQHIADGVQTRVSSRRQRGRIGCIVRDGRVGRFHAQFHGEPGHPARRRGNPVDLSFVIEENLRRGCSNVKELKQRPITFYEAQTAQTDRLPIGCCHRAGGALR